MLSVRPFPDTTSGDVSAEVEALIKEARRRHRRRWCARLAVGVCVLGASVAIVALAAPGTRSSRAPRGATAATLPTGPPARLHAAGPIAVAPGGALYVADAVGEGVK